MIDRDASTSRSGLLLGLSGGIGMGVLLGCLAVLVLSPLGRHAVITLTSGHYVSASFGVGLLMGLGLRFSWIRITRVAALAIGLKALIVVGALYWMLWIAGLDGAYDVLAAWTLRLATIAFLFSLLPMSVGFAVGAFFAQW